MRCHFLLQGIFPTQGSNPGLARWTLGKSTTFQNKNTVFSKQKLYSLSYNNLEKNRRRMNRQLNHFAVKTKTVETRAVSLHLHVYNLPSWLHRAHTPPAHSPPLHTHLLHVLLHTHLLSSLLHTRLLYKLISCMFICTLIYSAIHLHSPARSSPALPSAHSPPLHTHLLYVHLHTRLLSTFICTLLHAHLLHSLLHTRLLCTLISRTLITHRPSPSEPMFCAQHRARREGR